MVRMRPRAIQSCGRSRRWPTTAGVPSSLPANCSTRVRIVDRGDLSPSQLRGGWAGEIGQTQFLPTPYVRYAVDFDGNGHRDLVHSVPDILASTANFLAKPRLAARKVLATGIGELRRSSPNGTRRTSTSARSRSWPANLARRQLSASRFRGRSTPSLRTRRGNVRSTSRRRWRHAASRCLGQCAALIRFASAALKPKRNIASGLRPPQLVAPVPFARRAIPRTAE